MATTTNYSWSTPDDTALVKDGAAAIRTLGSSADTTVKALNPGTTAGDIDYYTTSTAKARVGIGTAGQVLKVNSGATAPEWGSVSASPTSASATVATEQSTTSDSYTDLATSGPAVTLTTGTKALVIVTARVSNDANVKCYASYAVSGSSTIAASDDVAMWWQVVGGRFSRWSTASRLSTLTAGSNTFTMKYKVESSTGYFSNREIIVIDLGS
jgi:hypothetical protein